MPSPRVNLSATPSSSRGELVAKLKFFFQEASTLSPHEFDAWFLTLTVEDRTTVHDILQPLHRDWPSQVEYPNVIALVHWLRKHGAEYRAERAAAVVDGVAEAGNSVTAPEEDGCENLRNMEEKVREIEEFLKEVIERLAGAPREEVAAAPTVPEPEPPVPEPTCPGPIDEEPQPQPIHPRPEPVAGMDVLAVLVMVLAPACLVRLLMILFLFSVLRQASNGMRRL
ncbi:uncharacterized protein J4E84_007050 [Alternaria hordeiaustralica]|uniref:uncharacterized protein n=1 Tax=Alternaria hordeiaustralica TaxID=1187925 RepID=UPI0020C2F8FC|nr:uncharacterized protein J4E84_007050 [Alternaria hordeiaustralica]KAI4683147.1 hypothetical protein J4E84_007050 [Alternaria hordeiaustralica]